MKHYIYIYIINILYAQISLGLVLDGFDKPVYVISEPEDSSIIYVVEQAGYIRMIVDGVELTGNIFLDISDRVHTPLFPGDEMGLLGFVFDPEFSNNGFIYVNYNDKDENTVISRFKTQNLDLKHNNIYVNSEKIILKFKQPYSNHNGGHLAFGKDGYLYISIGDGGSVGDPDNRAQNLENIFGKILRIDVLDNGEFIIPENNPFKYAYKPPETKKDRIGNLVIIEHFNPNPAIWLYGLRNVWRFSFDRLNGDMYLGDVGQNSWEEINFVPSGSKGGINFGWNIMEASSCFKEENCLDSLYQLPIFEYPNDAKYVKTLFGLKHKDVNGCSVTGGYVYRGQNIPELYGRYFFGDYCTGKIWSFKKIGTKITDFKDHTDELLNSINKKKFYLSSFGELANGELLLIDYSGSIYKLQNE